MTTPQFWRIIFPTKENKDGTVSSLFDTARDENEARIRAITHSRVHGHATVSNREGLVATYVNGREWVKK